MKRLPEPRRLLLMLAAATFLLISGAVAVLLRIQRRQAHLIPDPLPSLPAAFATALPQRVLWAWEEPEDLRTASATIGVAYLAETLLLSDHITTVPRRQPLLPAPEAPLMTVVRIETRPGFTGASLLRTAVATQLAELGNRPGSRALQIDFDATASQRDFYAGMLQTLRPMLRSDLPLSITALVSWCGSKSWLRDLPIDEAVPMFFRMGGLHRLATNTGLSQLQEPLCRTSLGVSTDEPWPSNVGTLNPAIRIYVFAPRPWLKAQLTAVATTPLSTLARRLAQ